MATVQARSAHDVDRALVRGNVRGASMFHKMVAIRLSAVAGRSSARLHRAHAGRGFADIAKIDIGRDVELALQEAERVRGVDI
jgi:hypothetical protein